MTNIKMKTYLFNRLLITTFILLSSLAIKSQSVGDLKIKINRQIKNKGFHRILNTNIEIVNLNYKYYNWLLVEQFDSNVYVDVHEIKQVFYTTSYKAIFSNKVNTETAEYKSQPFQLFIFIQNDKIQCDFDLSNNTTNKTTTTYFCKFTIQLPIHSRYKKPSSHSSSLSNIYFNFTLNKPKLFVRNQNDNKTNDLTLIDNFNSTSDLSMFPCQKTLYDYMFQIKSLINNTDYLICEWTSLSSESITFNETDSFVIEIPVGNSDYEMIVLIVTLVVVTFVALSVTRCVSKKVQTVSCICGDPEREEYHDENDEEKEKFTSLKSEKIRQTSSN